MLGNFTQPSRQDIGYQSKENQNNFPAAVPLLAQKGTVDQGPVSVFVFAVLPATLLNCAGSGTTAAGKLF